MKRLDERCDGVAVSDGNDLTVFVPCDGAGELGMVMPFGWDTTFGGVVSLTTFFKDWSKTAFVCLFPGTPEYEALRCGRLKAVFVRKQKAVSAYQVEFPETGQMALKEHLDRVDNHKPLHQSNGAAFWRVAELIPPIKDGLCARDRLAMGWAMTFKDRVKMLSAAVGDATGFRLELPEGEIADEFIDIVEKEDTTIADYLAFFDHLQAKHDGLGLHKFMESAGKHYEKCHGGPEGQQCYCPVIGSALRVYCTSSKVTAQGSMAPWIGGKGEVHLLRLAPELFNIDPADYWSRVTDELPIQLGNMVTGQDAPLDLSHDSPHWESFPRVAPEEVDAVQASATALLSEAVQSRQWTIPNGAIFQLQIGPFEYFEAREGHNEILFVGRSDREEFAQLALSLQSDKLLFMGAWILGDTDKYREIVAALRLLLAALVRDFLVVEERERVFGNTTTRRKQGLRHLDTTRIVYLPRVRYTGSPEVDRCSKDLSLEVRQAHAVAGHLRKSANPSDYQLILAQRYGFSVPKGYTFVRPHDRGGEERDVVYRSRSALRSLFTVTSYTGDKPTDWFLFERDMKSLLEKLGFQVQHVAAARSGDGGVDVYATKGDDLDEVNWIVQCKAYASKKVGPSDIRELVGSLSEYPTGTRAMLATTSSFTSGARSLAKKHNIRLMDGTEFATHLGR